MTSVAAPPVSFAPPAEHAASSRAYASIAPSGVTTIPSASPAGSSSKVSSSSHSPPSMSEARLRRTVSDDKRSPNSNRTPQIPKVVVKKEPTSPETSTSRHRPRRLDLSSMASAGPGALSSRGALTSKESGGLAVHDAGLACLSPGFNTADPTMQQQLQRSMSVRDQQRMIIEARQKGTKLPGDAETPRLPDSASLFRPQKMPNTARRKGPPPALSIAPGSHAQFANERVIQSAPLGQSFTGLRRNPEGSALGRQVVNQPSNLSHTSHIHHVPAIQTSNRLPPIADVFRSELPQHPQTSRNTHFTHSPGTSSNSNNQPLPSPGYPPHFQQQHKQQSQSQQPQNGREFKSAEEAVHSMVGGREELLPRLVHYGGHQPPTPPSPGPHKNMGLGVSSLDQHRSGASSSSGSRRRARDEYEKDNGSPPLGRGPQTTSRRTGPFGAGRDSPDTQSRKKEEFLRICDRAWDLFHS